MFEFVGNAWNALTGATPAPAAPPPAHIVDAAPPPVHEPAPATAPSATPATAPGQQPAAPGQQATQDPNAPHPPDPAQMNAAASQLFRAMDGWGTDEDAIHNALRGRSPAEIAAIRAAYADHFPGHNLDSDLSDEMSGSDLAEAQAQMTANPVDSAVASLRNASEGLGTNEDAIHATLNGIHDPAVRAQVAAEFERQTHQSLSAMLSDEMSGGDLAIAQHEVTGDTVGANAARLNDAMNGGFLGLGLGTDEDAVYTALENAHTPEERRALAEAYSRETNGRTLDGDLNSELSGAELDVASSLRTGDAAGAAAARMQVAADGLGTDEDAIFRTLSSAHTPQERQAMIDAYNTRYGAGHGGLNFQDMLNDEMGAMDSERARQLARDGHMDPAFALRYAMDGIGTDEDMIRDTLRGRSADEIRQIRAQYAQQTNGGSLDTDLSDENSGRDGFEITQMMLGEPRTPQERIQRLDAAWEFERGSGAGAIGNWVMDNVAGSDAGRVLDAQHARIHEIGDRLQSGQATDADLARLHTLGEYQQQDVQNYQAVQDSATNALATGATVAVGAIVTVATAGSAAPAVVAALAALAGGAAGMATKGLMLGSSYANEQIGIDAVQTIASAVTAGTLKMDAVGGMLAELARVNPAGAQSLMEAVRLGAVSGMVGGVANGVVAGTLDERTWRGPGNGLANFMTTVGTSTATGTAAGAVSGAVGHVYNEANGVAPTELNQGGVQATSTIGGALAGGAGALASTTTELGIQAVQNGGEIGRWENVLARYGQSVATGTVQGAADGYMTGVWQEGQRQAQLAAQQAGQGPHPTETQTQTQTQEPQVQQAQQAVREQTPATIENTGPLVEAAQRNPAPVADAPAPVVAPVAEAPIVAPPAAETPAALTPQQQEVIALRELATGPDDHRFIRQLEAEAGLPQSPLHPSEVDQHATLRQMVAETAGTDALTTPTEDLHPHQAQGQRTADARALMELQAEAGLTPGEGMDPRMLQRAEQQQGMVDRLNEMQSGMSPDERAFADIHGEQRAQRAEDPTSSTNRQRQLMSEQANELGLTQAALDAMTPEQRLLSQGFSPEEIAAHFTPRDVDADRVVPVTDAHRADADLTGQARQDANPALKPTGDLNFDHTPDLAPTVRRPMSPAEAQRAVELNAALYDSFHEGNTFGKIVPEGAVGDLMTGQSTGTTATGEGKVYGPAGNVAGDVGEQGLTTRPADRSDRPVNAVDQVQATGLDYNRSPFVQADPGAPNGVAVADSVARGNGVNRLEGTITPQMEARAEVCVGAGVMSEAQARAQALSEATAVRETQRQALIADGQPIPPELDPAHDPHTPRLLRTDGSADGMPSLIERNRMDQIDPRTGLGFSATERLGMDVVPGQELTISRDASGRGVDMPSDARVVTTGPDGESATGLRWDPATGRMVPTGDGNTAYYDGLGQGSQQRIDSAATHTPMPATDDSARYDDYWARIARTLGITP